MMGIGLLFTAYNSVVRLNIFSKTLMDSNSTIPDLVSGATDVVWRPFTLLIWLYFIFERDDVLPILVYTHISQTLKELRIEVIEMNQVTTDQLTNELELVWSHFEDVLGLKKRADQLFGFLVIISQGMAFFVICISFYSLLQILKQPEAFADKSDWVPVVVLSLLGYLIRIIFSVCLIAPLEDSSESLLSAIARLSVRRCRFSDKEERHVLKSFLGRLEQNQLVARPSGLYKVKHSLLLTLLSFILTYTIILLQSS